MTVRWISDFQDIQNLTLEEEFKKFGPIKPNGIQVRSNRVCITSFAILYQYVFYYWHHWNLYNRCMQGFSFGFVEFEVPEAVQKAIKYVSCWYLFMFYVCCILVASCLNVATMFLYNLNMFERNCVDDKRCIKVMMIGASVI